MNTPPLTVEIIGVQCFATFAESLTKLPIEQILPGVKSVEEGTQVYLKFASQDSQLKLGVCQIELKLVQSNSS